MDFWIIAALLSATVFAGIAFSLLRKSGGSADDADKPGLAIYRDQLTEIDRDMKRGVINEDDAARARVEISRRILDADKTARVEGQDAPGKHSYISALIIAAVLLGGSAAMYRMLGAPGYPDLPLEYRKALADEALRTLPAQKQVEARLTERPPAPPAEPRYVELVKQLRDAIEKAPNDIRGVGLLARHEAALGNFSNAHSLQNRLVALKGPDATADDYSALADMYVLAAEGFVSAEAHAAIRAALERDPNSAIARYYLGLLFDQVGRPDLGFQVWNVLVQQSPPDALWSQAIRRQMPDVAFKAGIEYRPPPPATATSESAATREPTADDVQAAAELSQEDREAMIQGMVEGLAARLGSEGGTPAEWAQLIRALGVLGRIDEASDIVKEAQEVFAGNEVAMTQITNAAKQAGIIE